MHSIGVHHHLKNKKREKGIVIDSRLARVIDVAVYPIGITSALMTIPQLYQIWIVENVAGVSIFSWFAWWIITMFWIAYALIHKAQALLVMNMALFVFDALIVLGIYLHS